jgi:hypothetical protein
MNRRDWITGMTAASIALPMAGCDTGPSYRYRYKLTLELEIDGQTRRAFNVVEDWGRTRSFPEASLVAGTIGEAMVIEVRPGRVLVPLLSVITTVPDTARGGNWTHQRGLWKEFNIKYGVKRESNEDFIPFMKRWIGFRGEREWSLDDLPDLVTFDDVNDPRTVKLVDPRNLEASFGPGVSLKRATIAIVDNSTPLTKGIEKKLPWIVGLNPNYLFNFGSAEKGRRGNSLAEILHTGHFAIGTF